MDISDYGSSPPPPVATEPPPPASVELAPGDTTPSPSPSPTDREGARFERPATPEIPHDAAGAAATGPAGPAETTVGTTIPQYPTYEDNGGNGNTQPQPSTAAAQPPATETLELPNVNEVAAAQQPVTAPEPPPPPPQRAGKDERDDASPQNEPPSATAGGKGTGLAKAEIPTTAAPAQPATTPSRAEQERQEAQKEANSAKEEKSWNDAFNQPTGPAAPSTVVLGKVEDLMVNSDGSVVVPEGYTIQNGSVVLASAHLDDKGDARDRLFNNNPITQTRHALSDDAQKELNKTQELTQQLADAELRGDTEAVSRLSQQLNDTATKAQDLAGNQYYTERAREVATLESKLLHGYITSEEQTRLDILKNSGATSTETVYNGADEKSRLLAQQMAYKNMGLSDDNPFLKEVNDKLASPEMKNVVVQSGIERLLTGVSHNWLEAKNTAHEFAQAHDMRETMVKVPGSTELRPFSQFVNGDGSVALPEGAELVKGEVIIGDVTTQTEAIAERKATLNWLQTNSLSRTENLQQAYDHGNLSDIAAAQNTIFKAAGKASQDITQVTGEHAEDFDTSRGQVVTAAKFTGSLALGAATGGMGWVGAGLAAGGTVALNTVLDNAAHTYDANYVTMSTAGGGKLSTEETQARLNTQQLQDNVIAAASTFVGGTVSNKLGDIGESLLGSKVANWALSEASDATSDVLLGMTVKGQTFKESVDENLTAERFLQSGALYAGMNVGQVLRGGSSHGKVSGDTDHTDHTTTGGKGTNGHGGEPAGPPRNVEAPPLLAHPATSTDTTTGPQGPAGPQGLLGDHAHPNDDGTFSVRSKDGNVLSTHANLSDALSHVGKQNSANTSPETLGIVQNTGIKLNVPQAPQQVLNKALHDFQASNLTTGSTNDQMIALTTPGGHEIISAHLQGPGKGHGNAYQEDHTSLSVTDANGRQVSANDLAKELKKIGSEVL